MFCVICESNYCPLDRQPVLIILKCGCWVHPKCIVQCAEDKLIPKCPGCQTFLQEEEISYHKALVAFANYWRHGKTTDELQELLSNPSDDQEFLELLEFVKSDDEFWMMMDFAEPCPESELE